MAALTRIALVAIVLLCLDRAGAQEATPPPNRNDFWKAEMPAGDYLVLLKAIRSISQHEYIVEGVAKVFEVSIATDSSVIARFYFLDPATPDSPAGLGQSTINLAEEKARELLDRTGDNALTSKVIKSYPVATHAHTVEYRVTSRDTLDKLYKHLERCWVTDRGGVFKP